MALTIGGRRKGRKACGTRRKGKRGGNVLGRAVVPFGLLALNQLGQRRKRRSSHKRVKSRRRRGSRSSRR